MKFVVVTEGELVILKIWILVQQVLWAGDFSLSSFDERMMATEVEVVYYLITGIAGTGLCGSSISRHRSKIQGEAFKLDNYLVSNILTSQQGSGSVSN